MDFTSVNRKTVRAAMHVVLSAGAPAGWNMFAYRAAALKGISPAILLGGVGSIRPPLTPKGLVSQFTIEVITLVLLRDDASDWTEAQAEDVLDDMELYVSNALLKNRRSELWDELTFLTPSIVDRVVEEGVPYLSESFMVSVGVFA